VRAAEDLVNRAILNSEIPPGHPSKHEIEGGLCSALAGLPGEWRITIVCSHAGLWWSVRVDGPRFDWMSIFVDGTQQAAPEIIRRLLQALRDSKVLS
jgi:hypothetical protein